MKEEKLKQLRKVFKPMIKDVIEKASERARLRQEYFVTDNYIQRIVNSFVYEVKIRINNK